MSKNMEQQLSLNLINRTTFARPDVVKYYQGVDELVGAEKILFERLLPTIKNSKVLDLGIGGGRTTKHLLEICPDYTGVDYVPQLAAETAQKYPDARILCLDARNLNEFEDQSFDFVLFSYNGLDCISNDDRLKVLKETYRVLKKGGIFMFSSHNRDYRYFKKLPWRRKVEFDARFLKFFLYCLYHLPKHYKMRKREVHADDYAIVNDPDHKYSLLLYYISIDKQVEQLTDIGFSGVEAYDGEGKLVECNISSHWLYYLAKKE